MHIAILIVSILMLALALLIPSYFLAIFIGKKNTALGSYKHFWEVFFSTIYLPILWFASFFLIRFVKG